MKGAIKKYIGDNRGQTLVEFALILMLILIVLFGITEFGRAWHFTNALNNGVRVGVRYASTLENTTGFENKVRSRTMANITSSIPNNNLVVTVTTTDRDTSGSLTSGDLVTVRATMDFSFLTGIMDFALQDYEGERTSLSRQATMRYE